MAARIPSHSAARASSYTRVLVGYDGSSNSQRALMRASEMARESKATLTVVVVVNTGLMAFAPMAPPIPDEVFEGLIRTGKQMLSDAMTKVGSLVPKVTGSVEQGNPAERILAVAMDQDVDLIVVGRRGISGVERFVLGGVSSNIIAHSKCDVLTVK